MITIHPYRETTKQMKKTKHIKYSIETGKPTDFRAFLMFIFGCAILTVCSTFVIAGINPIILPIALRSAVVVVILLPFLVQVKKTEEIEQ